MSTTLVVGRLDEIDVHRSRNDASESIVGVEQKTRGASDLYVQSNVGHREEPPAGTPIPATA